MRVLFMGTPELAARVLDSVAQVHEVVGVFTRPDAVRGRGRALVSSPVKELALKLGLEVHTPQTLKGDETESLIASLSSDFICVVAYGAILPANILGIPRYACLNVHTSLLPRWRGAAPIQRAILSNDAETGVSIMKMEEGLDTGPYCIQRRVASSGRYLADLEAELAYEGARSLNEAMKLIADGGVRWTEQADEQVTYAAKISKQELMLDENACASDNLARVRASSEAHPSRAVVAGRALTVIEADPVEDERGRSISATLEPGQAIFAMKRLFVRAADEPIEIKSVKPDGKKLMSAQAFAAGVQGIKGTTVAWGRA